MTYEANKYRVLPIYTALGRQQVVRKTRLEAIKLIGSVTGGGNSVYVQDFHQRKISPSHREKLIQVAKLWKELDDLENQVRTRKK